MGELFDHAKRQAEAARAIGAEHKRAQEAQEEVERQLSHQRALEFIDLMHQHDVPRIALNEEHWRKPLIARIYGGDVYSVSKRHLKLETLAMGWIAMEQYRVFDEYFDIFVDEKTGIGTACLPKTSWGDSYVVPHDTSLTPSRYLPGDRVFAQEEAMRYLTTRLVKLGIV